VDLKLGLQSGPEISSGNFALLNCRKANYPLVGTDLFAFFQFGRVQFLKPIV